jgi:hypothetical protein
MHIALAWLVALAAGCVVLPTRERASARERCEVRSHDANRRNDSPRDSDHHGGPILRLNAHDLAAVLDLLAHLDRTRPDWHPQLLDDLEHADANSVTSVVERWRSRLRETAAVPEQNNGDPAAANDVARDDTSRSDGDATDASIDAPVPADCTRPLFQSQFERLIASSASAPTGSPRGADENGVRPATHDEASAGDCVPPTWDELFRELADRMRERADGSDPDGAMTRVHAALLDILYQSVQAERPGTAPDPELWRQLAPAVALALGSSSAPRASQEVIESLQVATELLRGPGRFQVRGLAFCRRIRGYDNIERLETTAFAAGQPLLLYSEVEHFFSEPTDGGFHTKLSSALELIAPGGQTVWRQDFAAVEDMSDAPRRDFFLSHSLRLPAKLSPGRYILRITLHDELADRTTTGTIALTIR